MISTEKLNFGTQVNEHQVVSKCFDVTNNGNIEGCFNFQGSMPSFMTIAPLSGKLGPHQTQKIQVNLICEQIGDVKELIR